MILWPSFTSRLRSYHLDNALWCPFVVILFGRLLRSGVSFHSLLLSWVRMHLADVLSVAGSHLSLAMENLDGRSVVVSAGSHPIVPLCLLLLVLLARSHPVVTPCFLVSVLLAGSRLIVTQYFLVAVLLVGSRLLWMCVMLSAHNLIHYCVVLARSRCFLSCSSLCYQLYLPVWLVYVSLLAAFLS